MLITKGQFGLIIIAAIILGFVLCYILECIGLAHMVIGTMLIDRSKAIDICRIELDKPIKGKLCMFKIKYVNNLQSASDTYSIIGGDENGRQ